MSDGSLGDALAVLAVLAEYDQQFHRLEGDQLETRAIAFAEQFRGLNLSRDQLISGAKRAYAGVDKPRNPVGAVIAEAKAVRSQQASRRAGQGLPELVAPRGGVHGYALKRAYDVDGAIGLACPDCEALPGEVCEDPNSGGEPLVRKVPHTARLGLGYRLNNPRGRELAARRAAQEAAWREKHPHDQRKNW